ncbi:MAG: hypothetical protein QGF12_08660 [SAR202 cluster bacterium]|jgi:alpha-L-fucosidase|nr:hypothetical protein [SAR202 cluster bacterium]|tara:strand:- start:1425 stop:1685 length:261 start_codon:yes stop_codon:yes gene_type:complete
MIELDLKYPERVSHVMIMEDIACGERILKYAVEALAKDNKWQTLCTGECIGHKRIEQFDAVVTSKIRLRTISEAACQATGSPFRSI